MITVSRHINFLEAHIIKCRLIHESIPAIVLFEHHISLNWAYSFALGEVQVLVPRSAYDEAKLIIQNIYAGKYEVELNTEETLPKELDCPDCSNGDITRIDWSEKIALALAVFYYLPIPYQQNKYRCNVCSHKWVANCQRGHPLSVIILVLAVILLSLYVMLKIWSYWCNLNCDIYL